MNEYTRNIEQTYNAGVLDKQKKIIIRYKSIQLPPGPTAESEQNINIRSNDSKGSNQLKLDRVGDIRCNYA
ncbi:hypothetical protein AYI69_g10266 [Smittium culicis]|uniref:Uncharacterized protein n=1 Tax=Smittium culicis TaxID=133412 RepID=A0A1R1X6W4_9FUNG|nr:hypothetical protein AYI69_g10266 [Smittium culicis]